uniref:Uncharacterized protein n=1 Tax=Ixodes scapularis TaxID=6945 RepID=A0A4D5RC95_IXOSC
MSIFVFWMTPCVYGAVHNLMLLSLCFPSLQPENRYFPAICICLIEIVHLALFVVTSSVQHFVGPLICVLSRR